jgi:predicted glycosyltransferase
LPPLSLDVDSNDVSTDDSPTMQNDISQRREMILEKYSQFEPRVILIEDFPFGHRRHGDELMPMIEMARHRISSRPLVICSVTDIPSGGQHEKESHDDRITALLDKHFDAVLVHSDPVFARLEEFFQPRDALSTLVYHTGFVLRERQTMPAADRREKRILISAGGGSAGGPLYRAAVEAHRLLWDVERLPMTIIAGPALPQLEWQDLQKAAKRLPALTLKRSVPDLGTELAKNRWAVCHCGYNTAIDVIATRVSALLVPGGNSDKSEQLDRAHRLVHWGVGRMLMPRHLNGASLASGIHQLIKFRPAEASFNLDGAEITANLVYHLSLSEEVRPVLFDPDSHSDRKRFH